MDKEDKMAFLTDENDVKPEISSPSKVIKRSDIPSEYIPIEMSTNGRLGVPKVVYARNFKTDDIVNLSMANDDLIPERLISIVKGLMHDKTIQVENWPDKSVVEFLIKLYANFFTPLLKSIDFPWNESDLAWLLKEGQDKKIKDLQEG
jgi:hypothetical protein